MPKLSSFGLCCLSNKNETDNVKFLTHGGDKSCGGEDIYIRKLSTKTEFFGISKTDSGFSGMENKEKKQQQNEKQMEHPHFHRGDEKSTLQFDDYDDGMSVGYARILKTPLKERKVRLKQTDKENWSNDEDGQCRAKLKSNSVSTISVHENMAMIATIHPFRRPSANSSADAPGFCSSTADPEKALPPKDHSLHIEDVTDDPRYNADEDDAEFEEGALVEYCRSKVVRPSAVLKQPPLVVRRPSSAVKGTQNLFQNEKPNSKEKTNSGRNNDQFGRKTFEGELRNGWFIDEKQKRQQNARRNTAIEEGQQPAKIVFGGNSTENNRWRSNSSTGAGIAEHSLSSAGDITRGRQMAHVIDIEVGQPCSRMAICNCYGFRPHTWRKVCVHCKCDRNEHEPSSNQALSVYERLGLKPSSDMAKVMQQRKLSPKKQQQSGGGAQQTNNNNNNEMQGIGSVGHGYAWVPPGISRIKIEEYMSQLPNHMIPRLNSIGEKNREKQLMIQLPRQDLSIAYCKHLKTPQERRLYDEFVNARNEVALDIGFINSNVPKAMECRKCRGVIERNEMAIIAPKLGESTGWHAACFACNTCDQLLVDLTYCVRDEKVFCERHFAELHKPRCSACDELIFAGEYTKAMNKDWHGDHFCCWQCDSQLTGQRYILRDDHPYCIKCYEEIFANVCDECQKHIGIDSKDLSYKDKHWHEDCFLCSMCKVSLVDKPFGSKNERIFCSNCYDQAFATRCDGCGEIFKAGMKKMEYKGKQWHDKCFCCAHCKTPIGTRSFIPKNEEVYCAPCYEEKFATRCCKCKKVISTGGVTYKNEPWHRECFCCTNCNTSLAGQRFTSKEEKPYCADCYGELFAKRCSACVKPITGIGGAKFISFEDRHWHNDCFVCSQCTASLVGKGFITDGADILCADCAKARLMAANS
ncbi:hypothetical protein niasHT_007706 [Heterodera trifolii]|uniref:Uncharacterized protein n=1 Tax=Heterodera trifolii TaxID=157864 RepID=A0ABD2MAR7_9BILA